MMKNEEHYKYAGVVLLIIGLFYAGVEFELWQNFLVISILPLVFILMGLHKLFGKGCCK